jgi:hypothetical protein
LSPWGESVGIGNRPVVSDLLPSSDVVDAVPPFAFGQVDWLRWAVRVGPAELSQIKAELQAGNIL